MTICILCSGYCCGSLVRYSHLEQGRCAAGQPLIGKASKAVEAVEAGGAGGAAGAGRAGETGKAVGAGKAGGAGGACSWRAVGGPYFVEAGCVNDRLDALVLAAPPMQRCLARFACSTGGVGLGRGNNTADPSTTSAGSGPARTPEGRAKQSPRGGGAGTIGGGTAVENAAKPGLRENAAMKGHETDTDCFLRCYWEMLGQSAPPAPLCLPR